MYVKLFASILDSSIWSESPETRLVWITMLAMADRDGVVRSSPSGLSRRANVPVAACRKAIKTLSEPDLETSTQEYGGRRIEPIEGGFLLLNYQKYRDLRDVDTRREQTRERVRRHRAKKRDVTSVTLGNDIAEADTEAETEVEDTTNPTDSAAPERPTNGDWHATAAVALRESGVPESEIGDAIKNWWAHARRGFPDALIVSIVEYQGRYFKRIGTTAWNPARVWNPRNDDFRNRFLWTKTQMEQAERG